MPGLEIADALSSDPPPQRPLLKAHKTLPRRRDFSQKVDPIDTSLSNGEISQMSDATISTVSVTPSLPLTPPNQTEDDEGRNNPDLHSRPSLALSHGGVSLRSARTQQFSPPTPDITPPRVRDSTPKARPPIPIHPSMSSRAESFKTAREAFSDEDTLASRNTSTHSLVLQPRQKPMPLKHSPLANGFFGNHEDDSHMQGSQPGPAFETFDGEWVHTREADIATSRALKSSQPRVYNASVGSLHQSPSPNGADRRHENQDTLAHEHGLRDHLSNFPILDSPSLKKFGEDIGWDFPEREQRLMDRVNTWRLSGASATSTVEAVVIDSQPQKVRTLRHTEKKTSLRSVSSPNPQSTRTSWESSVESPHRLVHKAARISNRNRHSAASDMSVSASITSSQSPQKTEVIPVVVIPQRRSSLKGSGPNSRNHSLSRSQSSSRHVSAVSRSRINSTDGPYRQKKRTLSESIPSTSGMSDRDSRGRGFGRPSIPARSSSLSAPTSRNNSRSTSLTSESLRRHTEAMNSAGQKQNDDTPTAPLPSPRIILSTEIYPESSTRQPLHHNAEDVERLRAPSLHFTQSSVVSSSPGPVEINEATAMPLFPHNNRSLLLIDPHMQPESRAVEALRGRLLTVPQNVRTPEQSTIMVNVESPLRNPRTPPKPPAFNVIPPSPMEELDRQLGKVEREPAGSSRISRGLGSVRRALSTRRRSEVGPTLSRSFSTRSVRSRRAAKETDSELHPFWRPRGFWDDFDDSGDERPGEEVNPGSRRRLDQEDTFVSNSLGLPQKRVIFSGPLALARRISNSRRSRRGVRRQPSQGNLQRAKGPGPGIGRPRSPYQRRVRIAPGFGFTFHLVTFRELQQRIRHARRVREQARWDARRERLKQSIGEKTVADPHSVGPFNQGMPLAQPMASMTDQYTT